MKILITGGSQGIGAECVRTFAFAGHDVFFIYNKSDEVAEKLSEETGATAVKVDLGNVKMLKKALDDVLGNMGAVDVLVNNAGISLIKLFTDVDDAELKNVFDVNLVAATIVAREVSRCMVKKHCGKIINIGSVWGRVGASCEVVYSASKAGIEGLTKALAKELGPSGITVNCVEPGVIETRMNAELSQNDIAELCDATPLGRIGTTKDVADTVYWLSSEKANFITGQIIGVDGGFGI